MKTYPFYLFFLLISLSAAGQQPVEYGVRAMPTFIFTDNKGTALDPISFKISLQAGVYGLKPVNSWLSLCGEANYSLMRKYTGPDNYKVNYHYLGAALLPTVHAGKIVSIQAGAAANYLVIAPNDPSLAFGGTQSRFDVVIVGGFSLRYDLFEIQMRYFHSTRPYISGGPGGDSFRIIGVGLGYYFR